MKAYAFFFLSIEVSGHMSAELYKAAGSKWPTEIGQACACRKHIFIDNDQNEFCCNRQNQEIGGKPIKRLFILLQN